MNKAILASASIGRRKLFEKYFKEFEIQISDVDEDSISAESPVALVTKLARLKAQSVAVRFPHDYIFGFDTVVVCENQIIGKPENIVDARRMLLSLASKEQSVFSGFCVIHQAQGIEITDYEETLLYLKPMEIAFVNKYVETHEVTRFAGAYGVQDDDDLIEIRHGSFDNVIGAPMGKLLERLWEKGIKL